MGKNKYILTALLGVGAGLVVCLSCTRGQGPEIITPDTPDGERSVTLTVQLPQAGGVPTYVLTEIDENAIETIDVLVFDADPVNQGKWLYAYTAQGNSITARSGYAHQEVKDFRATLQQSDAVQQLVVLANVRAELEALNAARGMEKQGLLKTLLCTNTASWSARNGDNTFRPFPMWGEISATIDAHTTQVPDLKLLRAVARIDVSLGAAVQNANNFILNEIYIYNAKNKACVVPDPANVSGSKVTAVSLPEGSINNASALSYTVPPAMKYAFERGIYIFEARGGASITDQREATCIVIGGKFGTDTAPTYYRIDFLQRDGSGNFTTGYKDILRNHYYRVSIINLWGRGYTTPDIAFEAKAVNYPAAAFDSGANGLFTESASAPNFAVDIQEFNDTPQDEI